MNHTTLGSLDIRLHPVGVVKSLIKEPMLLAGKSGIELQLKMAEIREYHRQVKETVCEVIILPEYADLLDGIEDFSHILVLYWPHLIDPERRNLKQVHPMGRKDLPLKGIFATCSPARPNPVLVSAVPLVKREGSVLYVRGLEAVDGSPVVDIKPYVLDYYGAVQPRVADWMEQIHRELESGDEEKVDR